LAPTAGLISVTGLLMHGFGMWDKQRFETDALLRDGRLTRALYWSCWILLVAVLILVMRRVA
jgi:hypothetical protein